MDDKIDKINNKMVKFGLRLTRLQNDRLAEIAKHDGCSVSDLIRIAISEKYFKKSQKGVDKRMAHSHTHLMDSGQG